MQTHALGGNFNFQGARIDNLGATEYTLVTIAVDTTGSVSGFASELDMMLATAVEACKKSPRSDNLLVRVIFFSSMRGVDEIHGFKPLAEIDPQAYPKINPGGATPLYDACFSGIAAMNLYGKQLTDQDFGVNAIFIAVTDGANNDSKTSVSMVAQEIKKAVSGELVESLVSLLIGINASGCASELQSFKNDAGLDSYIDAGDVTKGKLAKIAGFISQSISSQSQALGTGGPSQHISATI